MKKIGSLLAVAVVVILLITACSKDNKYAKRLDGVWTISSITENDTAVDLTGVTFTMTFTKCKTTKEFCSGSQTIDFGTGPETETFQWQISEKGEKFTTRESDTTAVEDYDVLTIVEFEKDKLVLSDTEDGDVTVTTLTRQ